MLNRIVVSGNLGKDATLFNTSNPEYLGIGFSIATNEKRGDKEETTWHEVSYILKKAKAEQLSKHLKNGDLVYVEGKNTYKSVSYKLENGKDLIVKYWSIKASKVTILKSKASTETLAEIHSDGDDTSNIEIEGF